MDKFDYEEFDMSGTQQEIVESAQTVVSKEESVKEILEQPVQESNKAVPNKMDKFDYEEFDMSDTQQEVVESAVISKEDNQDPEIDDEDQLINVMKKFNNIESAEANQVLVDDDNPEFDDENNYEEFNETEEEDNQKGVNDEEEIEMGQYGQQGQRQYGQRQRRQQGQQRPYNQQGQRQYDQGQQGQQRPYNQQGQRQYDQGQQRPYNQQGQYDQGQQRPYQDDDSSNDFTENDFVTPQQPIRKQISIKQNINDNRLGLEPSGSIFTFTTNTISKFFRGYLNYHNIGSNVEFRSMVIDKGMRFKNYEPKEGDCISPSGSILKMYLTFSKNSSLVTSGRALGDVELEILGGRSSGIHIRMNQKFKECMRPFMSKSNMFVYEMKKRNEFGIPYCFIELNPRMVIGQLFKDNPEYEVVLIDYFQNGSSVVFKVLKQVRPVSYNQEDFTMRDIILASNGK